jgi:hypothetical protein
MSGLTSIDDFVFNINEEGKLLSSGFLVNSFLLNSGMSPMLTIQKGGNSSDMFSNYFDNLAIPAGLFYVNFPKQQYITQQEKHDVINDDIYEKLFQLVLNDTEKKKKKTKKNIIKLTDNKKTRKIKSFN